MCIILRMVRLNAVTMPLVKQVESHYFERPFEYFTKAHFRLTF